MRNDPRRRSVGVAAAALGIAGMLALSGCSASYWPGGAPEPAKTTAAESTTKGAVAPVPVSDAQIRLIVDRVASAAAAGDEKLNAEALAERFSGDALAQRTANYKIRAQVSTYASTPAKITGRLLNYHLVQSTETWPRTIFVTVESEAVQTADTKTTEAPSIALVLTQRIPQENFKVTRAISLRGGLEMPAAAPASEGTALLADNIESLVLQPGAVGAGYAAVLQGGSGVPEAAMFDLADDPLMGQYGQAWATQAQQKSDGEGKTQQYSVTVTQGTQPITSLSTGVGGALIATTIIESQVVDSAGGRYKPQAEGAVAALSGLSGQQDRIVRQVAHQLLFYVPSKSDGSKIKLLGVTSELVGAGK